MQYFLADAPMKKQFNPFLTALLGNLVHNSFFAFIELIFLQILI